MRKLGRWAGVALVVLLYGGAPPAEAGPDPEPTLRVPVYRVPRSLDPIDASGSEATLCVINLYDQLYQARYGARPYELEPCLADGMPQLSKDRRTVTIRIKKGVHYEDDVCFKDGKGRPVCAADVVFCLKRLMDPRTSSRGVWLLKGHIQGLDTFVKTVRTLDRGTPYPDVEGLKALDEHTVRMQLIKPWPLLPWLLVSPHASIYPPEAIATHGASFKTHPVTSGPYRLASFDSEDGLVFTRNPRYRTHVSRKARSDSHERMPRVSRVEITPFSNSASEWTAFMEGRIDLSRVPSDLFDKIIDQDDMTLRAPLRAKEMKLHKAANLDLIYDAFNMQDPVVGTPAGKKGRALRRAISLALDDDWSVKELYNSRAQRVAGMLLSAFPEHDPEFLNPWQRMPGETREEALTRARKILTDAGLPGGKGVPVLHRHILDGETDRIFFQAYQRDMAEIGVRVEAVPVSWPEFIRLRRLGKAQTWGVAWGADYPDAQNFFQHFYSRNGGGVNMARFSDERFDRLYEEATALGAGPRRTELYRRMQGIVVRECPWCFRFQRVSLTILNGRLQNCLPSGLYPKYFKHCVLRAPLSKER